MDVTVPGLTLVLRVPSKITASLPVQPASGSCEKIGSKLCERLHSL
jgi:hypothetical protein